MFYSLRGNLILCRPTFAVVECMGVGYKVFTSDTTYRALVSSEGQEVTVYTYLKVAEDTFDLYGFKDEGELELFKLLISVSGVGPKAGIAILSALSPEKLVTAVVSGDAKAISQAQGVGGKTAARVVLELKDKIQKAGITTDTEGVGEPTDISASISDKLSDVLDTLVVLGYKRGEAQAALKGVDIDALGLEGAVRAALNKLSRG